MKILIERCRPNFEGQINSQVRCYNRKGTVTPSPRLLEQGTFQEVSAHPYSSKVWITVYELIVRRLATEERFYLGGGSTAKEF